MTRLLFLPDNENLVILESPLPPDEIIQSVRRGDWRLPPPFDAWLVHQYAVYPALQASRFGSLVILAPAEAAQAGSEPPVETPPAVLSPHQRQVLQCLAEGLKTREIAARLHLNPRSIASIILQIKEIFGTSTRAGSVGRAAALGLVAPPKPARRRPAG